MIPQPDPSSFTEGRTQEAWNRRVDRIPAIMRETTAERLPERAKAFLAIEHDWLKHAKRGRGFIFAGPTGSGKTRAACIVALRMAAATWGNPHYMSCVGIRSKAFSDWGAANDIIETGYKAGILVLDDLGKGTPSPVVDDIMFAILDDRTNARKPTIITTQYLPDELLRRFKEPETGVAIMRRIREFNEAIGL